MDKLNKGLSNYELLIDETEGKKGDMNEVMPMLQNLSLDQIKGLIKLLGGKAA